MTLLNTSGQVMTVRSRRFIYHDAQSLVGKPLAGNGECVTLVQKYLPAIGHTTTWKAGARVVELGNNDIQIGTVIGTMEDGKWPGKEHNNHVGIFGGVNSRSVTTGRMLSFVLVEQYRAHGVTKIQARVIYSKGKSVNERYIDPSNNAEAFFVIEK